MVQQTMSDLFRQSKSQWLEEARATARKIGATKRVFTIEDVLAVTPLPNYLHRNTIGSVFKSDDFKPVGFTHSRRTAMHSRVIRQWSLNEQELPDNWAEIKASAIDGDTSRVSVVD